MTSVLVDQLQLMHRMLFEESQRLPPAVRGCVTQEVLVCNAKIIQLNCILDLAKKYDLYLQEQEHQRRNRDEEIWHHFLTLLDSRRDTYRDIEYSAEECPFPEEVLTSLEVDFRLYLKSHGL